MKEVIILGKGPSGVECPFDAEVWTTVNLLPEIDHKCSKVFAFDRYKLVKKGLDVARSRGIPIVSTFWYATEKYPFDEIIEEFRTRYLKITISYMIAYAIYLGYEKIRLYGVDAGPEWRYLVDKPYVTFWLGVATGRGIEWAINQTSLLQRAMAESIRKRYLQLKADGKFIEIARAGRDPFCFVTGMDTNAITVTKYEPGGGEVGRWSHAIEMEEARIAGECERVKKSKRMAPV